MKYLVIDYVLNFNFYCNSKNEVIKSLGYEGDGLTFDEVCERVDGEYDIIEINN
jgi:hypothetical protein